MARHPAIPRSAGRLRSLPLLIFSLVWTAFSLGIVGVGIFGIHSRPTSEGWAEVPCRIERIEIRDDVDKHLPFGIDLEFRYFHAGAERTGTRFAREETRFATHGEAADARADMVAGPEMLCQVNPADPNDAILIWNDGDGMVGKWVMGIFGGSFAFIGIGLLVFSIKGLLKPADQGDGPATPDDSSPGKDKDAGCIMIPFFGVFALAGLGAAIGMAGPMWKGYFAARSWVETPGEVIWSKVRSHSGDSTTYSAQIYYRYNYQDKDYQYDNTSFLKGSSSGRKSKEEMVRNHPPGKPITVWVNPQNPNEAILDRRLGHWAWFSLFPLPFLAVGFGGLYFTLRKRAASSSRSGLPGKQPARHASDFTTADPSTGHSLRLTPGKGRMTKFIGTLLFAAVWNGVISIFARDVVEAWQTGNQPWGSTLFLVPFAVVGIVALLGIPYNFGAIFNPRPVVEVTPASPGIGQSLSVRWEVPTGAGRLRDLRIVLRGEEAITRGSGKHAKTTRTTFFEREIARAETPEVIAMGRGSLRLPADAAPSGTLGEKTIRWMLEVHATIPFWSDIKDVHEVEVRSMD